MVLPFLLREVFADPSVMPAISRPLPSGG